MALSSLKSLSALFRGITSKRERDFYCLNCLNYCFYCLNHISHKLNLKSLKKYAKIMIIAM